MQNLIFDCIAKSLRLGLSRFMRVSLKALTNMGLYHSKLHKQKILFIGKVTQKIVRIAQKILPIAPPRKCVKQMSLCPPPPPPLNTFKKTNISLP